MWPILRDQNSYMNQKISKIEKLINILSPKGVYYFSISELCNVSRGRVISKEYLAANIGEFPVYSSQTTNNGVFGKINSYDYDGEYVTWTTDGANAGSIFYRNGKFNITNVCGLLKPKNNDLNTKFLSYALSIKAKLYVNAGMGNPKLMSNVMESIKIPLPPLSIQQEIVKILDTFTQLEAELEAELEARKKQYEYYRNEFFRKKNDVPIIKIGDVSDCLAGATPSTTKREYWENGTISWMSSGEVNYGKVFFTEKKITQKGYDNSSTKIVPPNTVVVALAGQGKTRGMAGITKIPLCTNQSLCSIIPNSQLNSTYLYHYLKSKYQDLRKISQGEGKRGGLNLKMIKNYRVPLPPIEIQIKIATKLEMFDSLVNDISVGLPAEIEARKQQYEYYRNKLLTFKEYVK